ncbi:hypothetical protein GCM10028822_32820 [Hymenobacter terrigena]
MRCRLGEEDHRVDDFTEHHLGTLVQQQESRHPRTQKEDAKRRYSSIEAFWLDIPRGKPGPGIRNGGGLAKPDTIGTWF